MPLREWLARREPAAPVALRARIDEVVAAHPDWEGMPLPEAMMAAGERLMADVLAAAPRDRAAALDLLAADACITYAFEAAAGDALRLSSLAAESMRRIAQLPGSV